MYSQGDIEDAVASGALAPEQASSLRAFVAGRNNTPTADEEYYRVFRGFNDWYVVYTVVLTLVTVGWIGSLIPLGGGGGRGSGPIPMLPFMAPLLVTGASWGLAEIFTRRRRTALPSILLAFTFGFGVLLSLIFMIAPILDGGPASASIIGALCCAAASGASWGYWLRFRQPVSHMLVVGFGVLGIVALIAGLFSSSQAGTDVLNVVVFLTGIATFAYAMWWDGSDPWRVTERSEVGLWMHGLASALLVFPIIYFLGVRQGVSSIGGALGFLAFYILFALVALAVNRKALLLAAISPLFIALNTLLPGNRPRGYSSYDSYGGGYRGQSSYGPPSPMEAFGGTVLTLVVVSLIMLALAIWWAPLRRIVSGILPESLRARAPAEDLRAVAAPPPPYEPPPPPPIA
jgi:hypothetical protein